MVFKDQCMWGQVVVSIGKLFMAIALHPFLAYQNLPHPAHGVAAVLVAARLRSPPKISLRFIETQNVKSLMQLYLTSGKLIVSLVFF